MGVIRKVKRAIRGEVEPGTVLLESLRRAGTSLNSWRDLATLNNKGNQHAKLKSAFARKSPAQLLSYFKSRQRPILFAEPLSSFGATNRRLFPTEANELIKSARRICKEHRWALLGLGELTFGGDIAWRRDPLSRHEWPLEYHRNVRLMRGDGSDVRLLWELNRLGHLLSLAQAYKLTSDENFAGEFFQQVQSWKRENPYGQGPNWTCAMEVALRATNLIAAFEVFRQSPTLSEQSLKLFLDLLYQHGVYIRRNLEFSYIATSNHYLSDVVGLLWIGILLPELADADDWRRFGFREMLREMDKQVLADGADFESSTGYHRFVLELFLYSFLLCRHNRIEIPQRYWDKLHLMLKYTRGYLRPDLHSPLLGDTDSGQFLPLIKRPADDHAYVLSVGAVAFGDPDLRVTKSPSPEVISFCGDQGVAAFEAMPALTETSSIAFRDAGTYVMRHQDLYLCLCASSAGIGGRGSHGHNDALSIEVSACGRAFIVDPGTYVYSADLRRRHQFRSTAYHSTVQVDGEEQNTTELSSPFVRGDEAKPRLLLWETGTDTDRLAVEHYGYTKLPSPLIHRRAVAFSKKDRSWLIEDQFDSEGKHELAVRFHFDSGLEIKADPGAVVARDPASGASLSVRLLDGVAEPSLEQQSTSRDYGSAVDSISACWRFSGRVTNLRWELRVQA